MFRQLWRNKILVIFIVALLVLFPAASIKPAQMLSRSLFFSVGIDKTDEGYQVSGVVAVNRAAQPGERITKSVQASGPSITVAMKKIASDEGRLLSLVHCNLIVIGSGLQDVNLATVLSNFLRQYEMSNNALLVCTDGDVLELLEASMENRTGATAGQLETVVAFNQDNVFSHATTLDNFFKSYLRTSSSSILSIVNMSGGEQEEVPVQGAVGGGGGSDEASAPKVISNTRSGAVFRNGKRVFDLTADEVWAVGHLFAGSSRDPVILDNISGGDLVDAQAILQPKSKRHRISVNVRDGVPVAKVTIHKQAELYQITEPNAPERYLDLEENPPIDIVSNALRDKLLNDLNSALDKIKFYRADFVGLHDTFHRFNTRAFHRYMKNADVNKFLDEIEFEITINAKVVI